MIQISGDGPTLSSLRAKVWVGAGLGLGLGLREGRVGKAFPQKPGWSDFDIWTGGTTTLIEVSLAGL